MSDTKKATEAFLADLDNALRRVVEQRGGVLALLKSKGLEDPKIPLDILGNVNVYPDFIDPNMLAYVSRAAPRDIKVNINAKKFPSHTMRHELEHVFQNMATDRYENNMYSEKPEEKKLNNFDSVAINELAKLKGIPYGEARHEIRKMLLRGNDPAVRKRLEELGLPTDTAYLGERDRNNPSNAYSLRETLAELRALEEQNNLDLANDKTLNSLIFDDQDLVDWYNGVTGLRTNRLDAKDLPPMTPQKSPPKPEKGWLQRFKELMR